MPSIDDKTHKRKWLCFFSLSTHLLARTLSDSAHADTRRHAHAQAGTLNDGIITAVAVFYLPVAEDRIRSSKRFHFFPDCASLVATSGLLFPLSIRLDDWSVHHRAAERLVDSRRECHCVIPTFFRAYKSRDAADARPRFRLWDGQKAPRTTSAGATNGTPESDFMSSFNWLQHIL